MFLLFISFLQACKQKGTDSLPDTEEEMRMEENPFSKVPGVAEQIQAAIVAKIKTKRITQLQTKLIGKNWIKT